MISFGAPAALLSLLALLPAGGALFYHHWRDAQSDVALGGGEPLRRGRSTRRVRIRHALLLGALTLAALAAARPQWGTSGQPVTRRGIDIAIALDVSRSMTATDVTPTRAEAAARGLGELIDHLQGDRVGLVTFAGSTFLRSPLTLDLDAIRQLIGQAQVEAPLLRAGTSLAAALDEAQRILEIDSAATTQVIVIVSDGEDQSPARLDEAIHRLTRDGLRVYAVIAGTDAGVDIPTDGRGNVEHTAVDRATLELIASSTGGELRTTSTVAGLAVEFARMRQSQFDQSEQTVPVERYQWLLAAALALLLAQSIVARGVRPLPLRASRISLGFTVLLALGIVACGGSAASGHVRDGNDAFDAGRFDEALTEYRQAADLLPEDPTVAYDAGNTLHQLRRFEEATPASSFAAATTQDSALFRSATYALGSHAFERGALGDARDAFVEVLRRDPTDEDARYNLELVLLALQPPPPAADAGPQEQAPDDSEQPDNSDSSDTQQGSDGPAAPEQSASGPPTAPDGSPIEAPDDDGQPTEQQTLQEARQALADAIVESGSEVTVEQALELLDLVRLVNRLQELERSDSGGGNFPAR
ncbi:MAG TPA: VWA domain-containing protein [Dehalococcoidia bacterium]|nr:VWA domain-containing protein [Dehalococcoidia bacterium]